MRRKASSLTRILDAVATITLASLAGCGGESSGEADDSCDATKSMLANAGLPAGVDYVALRFESAQFPGEAKTNEEAGAACAKASDQAKCTTSLAALREKAGWPYQGNAVPDAGDLPHHYLVVTRGDEIRTITTDAQLRELYGAIDTRAKAAIVAKLRAYTSSQCSDFTREGNGFTFTQDRNVCMDPNGVVDRVKITVQSDAIVTEGDSTKVQQSPCPSGRRPEGFEAGRSIRARDAVGMTLATMAELEAASVFAFDRLERELVHHGAPTELCARAASAKDDEIRHARTMTKQAERFGATPSSIEACETSVRSLEEIAIENLVEGCVRETYGALVAAWQGKTAGDPVLRRTMRAIAVDEGEHASLAWDVWRWIAPRLSDDARSRARTALREAVARLREEIAAGAPRSVTGSLGVPDAREGRALFDALLPSWTSA